MLKEEDIELGKIIYLETSFFSLAAQLFSFKN